MNTADLLAGIQAAKASPPPAEAPPAEEAKAPDTPPAAPAKAATPPAKASGKTSGGSGLTAAQKAERDAAARRRREQAEAAKAKAEVEAEDPAMPPMPELTPFFEASPRAGRGIDSIRSTSKAIKTTPGYSAAKEVADYASSSSRIGERLGDAFSGDTRPSYEAMVAALPRAAKDAYDVDIYDKAENRAMLLKAIKPDSAVMAAAPEFKTEKGAELYRNAAKGAALKKLLALKSLYPEMSAEAEFFEIDTASKRPTYAGVMDLKVEDKEGNRSAPSLLARLNKSLDIVTAPSIRPYAPEETLPGFKDNVFADDIRSDLMLSPPPEVVDYLQGLADGPPYDFQENRNQEEMARLYAAAGYGPSVTPSPTLSSRIGDYYEGLKQQSIARGEAEEQERLDEVYQTAMRTATPPVPEETMQEYMERRATAKRMIDHANYNRLRDVNNAPLFADRAQRYMESRAVGKSIETVEAERKAAELEKMRDMSDDELTQYLLTSGNYPNAPSLRRN